MDTDPSKYLLMQGFLESFKPISDAGENAAAHPK